jgi:hypothetical protein
MPMTNMSNDYVLTQMCNEATAAFYCINTHMTSFEGQILDFMNSTLPQIGKIVYGKCQGICGQNWYTKKKSWHISIIHYN